MAYHTGTIAESQVDWLTITTRPGPESESLQMLGDQMLLTQADLGNERIPWSWRGYCGERAGAVLLGTRDDSSLLTVSGHHAASYIQRVWKVGHHVTRLDLQVTYRFHEHHANVAAGLYAERVVPIDDTTFASSYTLLTNSKGGQTLYVGAPSSDQRGRVYDKAAESQSDSYRNCWRYEVQLRGDPARFAAEALADAQWNARTCSDLVWSWYTRRHVRVPWTSDTPLNITIPAPGQTDADKKIAWLALQVGPAVAWLARHGDLERAISVLGIDRLREIALEHSSRGDVTGN